MRNCIRTIMLLLLAVPLVTAGTLFDFTVNIEGSHVNLPVNLSNAYTNLLPYNGVQYILAGKNPFVMDIYGDDIWMTGLSGHDLTTYELDFGVDINPKVNGTFDFTGSVWTLRYPDDRITGTLVISGNNPAPEPSSLALTGIGMAGAALLLFKRRRAMKT